MPKSKDADNGAANLKAVLSNQSSLSDLTDEQLAAVGGSRDPIDSEDFSAADFGNEVTESPGDEAEDEVDETPAKSKEDPEEGEESTDEPDADADEEEEEGEAEDKGDDSDEPGDGDAEGEDQAGDDAGDDAGDAGEDESDAGDSDDGVDDSDAGEEAEEEGEEDPPAGKKDQRVPLDRFRKVNKQMREMQRELETLKAERAAERGRDPENEEQAYDFDAAEERYQDLLLDGKKKDAAALRKEIRAAERAEFQKDADVAGNRHAEASHAKRGLDKLAAQYEQAYPEMDANHEDFNPEINLDVQASMVGYIDQGMDPVEAFEKALKTAVKLHGLTAAAPAGKGKTPAPAGGKGKGKAPGKTPDPVKEKQKTAAGKEKAAKAKKAPPNTTKVGDAGDAGGDQGGALDIMSMSEEEFNALPKSKLARLRGDIL